jgi:hypothetical protein
MRAGMRQCRRLGTAVAFGGTAALAVMVSRPGPNGPSLNNSALASAGAAAGAQPVTAACATAALRVSVGPGSRVTPMLTRYAVDFTNVSAAPCTLAGYPQVTAFRGRGVRVGGAAGQEPPAKVARVLLAPGQTAHAALDAALPAARCRPVQAAGLRVAVAPGTSPARYVPRRLTACAVGSQDYLRVHAIQAGAGLA